MKHTVRVKCPHLHSMAAGVLLARKLSEEERSKWLEFRDSVLQKRMSTHGELRCHYCGRTGLVSEVDDNATKEEFRHLATLDHIIPRSKGGAEFDERNVVVACYPCNQRKADLLPEEFKVGVVA